MGRSRDAAPQQAERHHPHAKQCVAIDDATPGGLSGYLWSFVAEEDNSPAPLLEVRIPSGPTLSLKAQFINNYKDASCGAYQNTFGQTSEVSDRLEAVLRKKNKDGAAGAPFAEPFRFGAPLRYRRSYCNAAYSMATAQAA